MSDTNEKGTSWGEPTREELIAALFGNMIMQQTNMALMFLGKMPHPETGQRIQDMEMAQLFIDQLEMLEVKTKGNLSKEEEGLLKQSLTAVRLAFVETAREQSTQGTAQPAAAPPEAQAKTPAEGQPKPSPEAAAAEAESHKKFSKKY